MGVVYVGEYVGVVYVGVRCEIVGMYVVATFGAVK